MKTYYEQLEPHVTAHVKSYIEDFTTHDRKALEGYTGKFIYGYRDTGTNLFLIDPYFKALDEVLATGRSAYFTDRGMYFVKRAELSFRKQLDVMAIDPIFTGMQQEKFVIADKGTIKHVTKQQMQNYIDTLQHRSDLLQTQIRRKHYKPEPSFAY